MKIERKSPFTGAIRFMDIDVTQEQLDKFNSGEGLIQDIMPDISANEREFILSGITPREWDELFGEE